MKFFDSLRLASAFIRHCGSTGALAMIVAGTGGTLFAVASAEAAGLQFGGMLLEPAGNGIGTYSTTPPLAAAVYLVSVVQSGDFALSNVTIAVNGVSAGTGGLAFMSGATEIHLSGVIPPSTAQGKIATVTVKITTMGGSAVVKGSAQIQVQGETPDWQLVWKRSSSSDPLGEPILHIGDFDGDGADEIMAVSGTTGTNDSIKVLDFIAGNWVVTWDNHGDPTKGGGIYPYRGALTVGDFDGNGKDEVLGTSGWITMFVFNNGDWHWGWSNGGDTSKGGGIYPYKDKLTPADVDGDGRDELIGSAGGWITMFRYLNDDWHWSWSSGGDPTKGEGFGAYAYGRLQAGDINADGKDEIIALDGWGTTFSFSNNDFRWGWSTGSTGSFGGWGYPLKSTDRLIIGNFDHFDAFEELLFLQTGANAKWATTFDFRGGKPNWHWSTGTAGVITPFIGKFPVASLGGTESEYFAVKPIANQPSRVLCRRKFGGWREAQMYRIANTWLNF